MSFDARDNLFSAGKKIYIGIERAIYCHAEKERTANESGILISVGELANQNKKLRFSDSRTACSNYTNERVHAPRLLTLRNPLFTRHLGCTVALPFWFALFAGLLSSLSSFTGFMLAQYRDF